MFWSSVLHGLGTLLQWEIVVGLICVGAANLALIMLVGVIFASSRSAGGALSGFVIQLIGGPFVQAIAITAFVVILLPSLLGGDGFAPIEMIVGISPRAMKYGFLSLVLILLLCFIPFVGTLIMEIPGLATFIQGMFILRPLARSLVRATLGRERPIEDFFPGFFACAGYFLIGLVLCFLTLGIVGLIEREFKRRFNPVQHILEQYSKEPTGLQVVLGQFVGPVLGVIPLLMYGKHIALAVAQAM